jgi:hypothetical protein
MDTEQFNQDLLNKEHRLLSERLIQAKFEKNLTLMNQLKAKLSHVETQIWKIRTARFHELAEYSSFLDALKHTANKLKIPFPDTSPSSENQFLFAVSDDNRGVLIIPREPTGLNNKQTDPTLSYRGGTESLEDVVSVFSRWYMLRDSIGSICRDFAWISTDPVEVPD